MLRIQERIRRNSRNIKTKRKTKQEMAEKEKEQKKLSFNLEKDVPGIYIKHHTREEKVTIEKNSKLIPIKEFSITNLPPCYQHGPEMFDLIISVADLTVKIEVTGASEKWNKFWADNKSPNDMSQFGPLVSSDILMGSGKVHDMFIRTENNRPNPCLCEKCKNCPVKEWAEILIVTTAQLLYDHDDASHFSASFSMGSRTIKVQGSRIVSRSIEKDLCKFMCVTCDVESVRDLEDKLDLFEACWANAYDKYAETIKWEKERLVVIVSHPYGQKKHISLGKKIETEYQKRIAYDTPTFPGSSGAYVLIPDFDVIDEFLPLCLTVYQRYRAQIDVQARCFSRVVPVRRHLSCQSDDTRPASQTTPVLPVRRHLSCQSDDTCLASQRHPSCQSDDTRPASQTAPVLPVRRQLSCQTTPFLPVRQLSCQSDYTCPASQTSPVLPVRLHLSCQSDYTCPASQTLKTN